jgi:hypothetical protein
LAAVVPELLLPLELLVLLLVDEEPLLLDVLEPVPLELLLVEPLELVEEVLELEVLELDVLELDVLPELELMPLLELGAAGEADEPPPPPQPASVSIAPTMIHRQLLRKAATPIAATALRQIADRYAVRYETSHERPAAVEALTRHGLHGQIVLNNAHVMMVAGMSRCGGCRSIPVVINAEQLLQVRRIGSAPRHRKYHPTRSGIFKDAAAGRVADGIYAVLRGGCLLSAAMQCGTINRDGLGRVAKACHCAGLPAEGHQEEDAKSAHGVRPGSRGEIG